MSEQFVHLHNHTEFSLLDGYGHPEEYLEQASTLGNPAFAVTEHGNEYSWVYFDKLKNKYPNIKMIYGVELYEAFNIKEKDIHNKYFHLIALAKNEQGRIALNELVTQSEFEGFYFHGRVDLEMLKPYGNDLIITSACLASKLAKETDFNKCIEYVNEYKSIFPYFYLEMQSHNTQEQCAYNKKIIDLAKATDTEFIITCDAHAPTEQDLYYQKYHVKIAHDNDTANEIYSGCYMQSVDEIHEIMDKQIGADNVSIAMENTVKIANMTDDVNMPFQPPQLPTYPLPSGYNNNFEYLKHLCELGWVERNIDNMSEDDIQIRRKRLDYELSVIHQMGFDGYFLIVWDFIKWARENNYEVGDGRGSGAGSIVNYCLGISNLDPIEYNLIFERFLNPERVSLPDIDTDFAQKDKVLEYLMNKYGEEKVCQIINFSYITPVVAIKDVGKILGIPYKITEKISKKFTDNNFQANLDNDPSIMEEYTEYAELFDIASHLSGRVKTVSVHAGGVGIVDTKITDYMAMKLGKQSEHVIQVDKHIIEDIGIIKFDLLGVSTLNIVHEVKQCLGISDNDFSATNKDFLNDAPTYELLCSGLTDGVFQVESQGMKDLLKRLKPSNIEDVSAVLALYRPDSMAMLEDYIHNKHHPEDITYWHEDMKPILKNTYGCIIYQEEVMEITRVFGGRTYGGADKFRKAIGKKNIELVKSESNKLYQEIVDNGYDTQLAKKISDYLAEMGGYSFNSAHSMAYALLTYKTAYLKANYPVEFFCALLNKSLPDKSSTNYGAINKYITDGKNFNVIVTPPNINYSELKFTVKNGKILFGLGAISGLGDKMVSAILTERKLNGKFKNLKDFIQRVNPSTTVVISLVKAGAIPCRNKHSLLISYAKSLYPIRECKPVKTLPKLSILKDKYNIDTDTIKDKEERLKKYNIYRKAEFDVQQSHNQHKLVSEFADKYLQSPEFWEFEALSVFLTDNPFAESNNYITRGYNEVEDNSNCVVVGVIANIQKKKDRNQQQFAFINVYSTNGIIEITVWASKYKTYSEQIKRGNKVALLCYKQSKDSCQLQSLKDYNQWLNERKRVNNG